MKPSKKLIGVIPAVALVASMSLIGCGKGNSGGANDGAAENAPYVPESIISLDGNIPDLIPEDQTYTSSVFSAKGATDYKIVLPEQSLDNIVFAATELSDRFTEATGGAIETVRDNEIMGATSGKYIFLGENKFLPNDLDISEDTLGVNGYVVKTVGDDVFIAGANERAAVNGVYDFLKCTFNYRFYAPKVWQINDCTNTDVYMPEFDKSVRPTINIPCMRTEMFDGSPATGKRYRVYNTDDVFLNINGWGYHTATNYVPESTYLKSSNTDNYHPEWYATLGNAYTEDQILRKESRVSQVCYNAHGVEGSEEKMLEAEMAMLKKSIIVEQKDPHQLAYAWYTQMDNYDWCGCDKCKADTAKYGSPAGSFIKHANKLAKMLEDWIEEEGIGRRVNLVMYAYMNTLLAPTYFDDDIKMADNISLFYAPIRMSFVKDFDDEYNKTFYDNLENWYNAVGEGGLLLWAYNLSYYSDYIAPHYGFDAFQQNIEILSERFDFNLIFASGDYENLYNPDFGMLKFFLNAELMWDCTLNVNTLIDEYFNAVYRDGATAMRKYYVRFCNWYNYIMERTGFIGNWTNTVKQSRTEEFFPLAELRQWMSYIDEAYDAIEKYREVDPELYVLLSDAICLESITPRYLMLDIHRGSFDTAVVNEMQSSYDNDCARLGIVSLGEGGGRWD